MKMSKFSRLLSLFMVMFTMFSLSAFANNSDYYSKATAKAVGSGKVYVSFKSATDAPEYATESSALSGKDNKSSAPTHTYYLYAQPDEGFKFVGWYDNEECSGEALSEETTYSVKFAAESTSEAAPTTQNYFAKFVNALAPYLVCNNGHIYLNIDDAPTANDGIMTEVGVTLTYSSSNEAVATVDAEGKVTPVGGGSATIVVSAGYEPVSYVVTVIDNREAGLTQIGNGGFEDWRGVSDSNHAPENWNSFETNEGDLATMARAVQVGVAKDHRPGSNGLYCADIWSRSVLGVVAQGNLTTGCINAGAAFADDKGNYNYSKTADPNKSETLSKIPTAIRFWAKFVPSAVNARHPNAHMEAVVHDNFDYITYCKPEYESDAEKSHVIARARKDFPTTDGEWQEFVVPFTWTGNAPDGQLHIIVNLATNADPGEGQTGDHLYIDDVELLYDDEAQPVAYDKFVSVSHTTPTPAAIEVTYNYNDANTIDFNLKNFILNGMPVGNVTVPGLAIDNEGKFSYEGTVKITAGDLEGVQMWMGPNFGDVPLTLDGTIKNGYLYVHLNINMGQPIEVEVGDMAEAALAVGDALVGTFCAPFTVFAPEAAAVSIVTAAGDNGALVLEPVPNGVIPANTPVVIEAAAPIDTVLTSGIIVKGEPAVGLLTGVYEDTKAPVGSYVLQNNNDVVGFYQVAANSQPTVKANHAYLTVPAAQQEVKAFFLNAQDATAISGLTGNTEGTEAVFNMAGQRVQKAQRGIYIVNGKKVLVK